MRSPLGGQGQARPRTQTNSEGRPSPRCSGARAQPLGTETKRPPRSAKQASIPRTLRSRGFGLWPLRPIRPPGQYCPAPPREEVQTYCTRRTALEEARGRAGVHAAAARSKGSAHPADRGPGGPASPRGRVGSRRGCSRAETPCTSAANRRRVRPPPCSGPRLPVLGCCFTLLRRPPRHILSRGRRRGRGGGVRRGGRRSHGAPRPGGGRAGVP
jgi:hypothetical protein